MNDVRMRAIVVRVCYCNASRFDNSKRYGSPPWVFFGPMQNETRQFLKIRGFLRLFFFGHPTRDAPPRRCLWIFLVQTAA